MKASELIEKLQRAIEEYGDQEVMTQDNIYGFLDVDDVKFSQHFNHLYIIW